MKHLLSSSSMSDETTSNNDMRDVTAGVALGFMHAWDATMSNVL